MTNARWLGTMGTTRLLPVGASLLMIACSSLGGSEDDTNDAEAWRRRHPDGGVDSGVEAGVDSSADAGQNTGTGSGSTVQPGTPAALGDPTPVLFNDLLTVVDKSGSVPTQAVPALVGTMPAALASAPLPYVPDVKVVVRHDSAIFYFANVAGAGDYRAYVVDPNVTFAPTKNGTQPRGAVLACAGFRQHTYRSELKSGHHTRELLQMIELPGLTNPGTYDIVLEATKSPCPYVGMPAHTDAQITMETSGTTNWFHAADPGTYRYSGIPVAVFESFDSAKKNYGNEQINGQGAAISYTTRETAPKIGGAVPPNDATIPSDPDVIARSALSVTMPPPDEGVFDVGPHSLTDEFSTNMSALPATFSKNPDYADYNNFSINPLFQMGTWEFWGRLMTGADGPQPLLATQAFMRHGRLYTTFGDAGQDVGGTLSFASLETPVLNVDSQKYIHSTFRVSSSSTHRRYWYWTMCGAQTSAELFDATKKEYKLRPVVFETTFATGGNNPSVPDFHTLEGGTADDAVGIAKECISFTEEGRPEDPFRTDGSAQTSASLHAQIHPKNKSHGIIQLGNDKSDVSVLNGVGGGFRYRVDAAGNRVGPMIDPYDQASPLTQYDIFVRTDRMVVFVNGRQGFCVDLSSIPLTSKFAMLGYGDLLYHSSVEWQELSNSAVNKDAQLYQQLLNTPIATSRTWDVVGHSDGIDIPSSLSFDPATCRKPSNMNVR